eukprot:c10963_g1_i2.p2 GENE.c10963_g1_i2~~c10963_g1_i2.p2  ORF type:complete len:845 (+),score=183.77 c10963_g1_i2:2661-5195(+)
MSWLFVFSRGLIPLYHVESAASHHLQCDRVSVVAVLCGLGIFGLWGVAAAAFECPIFIGMTTSSLAVVLIMIFVLHCFNHNNLLLGRVLLGLSSGDEIVRHKLWCAYRVAERKYLPSMRDYRLSSGMVRKNKYNFEHLKLDVMHIADKKVTHGVISSKAMAYLLWMDHVEQYQVETKSKGENILEQMWSNHMSLVDDYAKQSAFIALFQVDFIRRLVDKRRVETAFVEQVAARQAGSLEPYKLEPACLQQIKNEVAERPRHRFRGIKDRIMPKRSGHRKSVTQPLQVLPDTNKPFFGYEAIGDIEGVDKYNIEWLPVGRSSRLFANDMPRHTDIVQGAVGNCWFFSALMCMTKADPQLVKGLFVESKCNPEAGIYCCRLYSEGAAREIEIDCLFPMKTVPGTNKKEFVFAQPVDHNGTPVLWVCVLEKCYAKLWGSYSALHKGEVANGFFELGLSQERLVFVHLLLTITEATVEDESASTVDNSNIFSALRRPTLDELWQHMSRPHAVACSMPNLQQKLGLVSGHAYPIHAVHQDERNIRLVALTDPLGISRWEGDYGSQSVLWTSRLKRVVNKYDPPPGSFWMSFGDFLQHFEQVVACELLDTTNWAHQIIQGKWGPPDREGRGRDTSGEATASNHLRDNNNHKMGEIPNAHRVTINDSSRPPSHSIDPGTSNDDQIDGNDDDDDDTASNHSVIFSKWSDNPQFVLSAKRKGHVILMLEQHPPTNAETRELALALFEPEPKTKYNKPYLVSSRLSGFSFAARTSFLKSRRLCTAINLSSINNHALVVLSRTPCSHSFTIHAWAPNNTGLMPLTQITSEKKLKTKKPLVTKVLGKLGLKKKEKP